MPRLLSLACQWAFAANRDICVSLHMPVEFGTSCYIWWQNGDLALSKTWDKSAQPTGYVSDPVYVAVRPMKPPASSGDRMLIAAKAPNRWHLFEMNHNAIISGCCDNYF